MITMILDRLQHADTYRLLHPAFAEAFRYLARPDLDRLAPGRHEIDGDRLYAVVVKADGKGRGTTRLEAHRKYIDIQYTVAGSEAIGWKAAGECESAGGFDPAKDIEFYPDAPESWVEVPPGTFAVFFPEDAHAPLGGQGRIVKVVVKVAVNP
jgi:biofilm protein TabA